jgi:CO/xanthine dehydrogenase FAD-binding subunit
LRNATEARRVKFTEFYTGYRKSVKRPDELILALEIPRQTGTQWFRKVGTRAAQAISKIVMAAVRNDSPRIAIGSVAPTIIRVPRTEAALAAGRSIEEAAEILTQEIEPIDDVRSTAEYRRTVTANLLRRFWADTAR